METGGGISYRVNNQALSRNCGQQVRQVGARKVCRRSCRSSHLQVTPAPEVEPAVRHFLQEVSQREAAAGFL